ncbi:uncharacterized protein LOC119683224 [Teleopsis dalmanni]|uniref:uncharacterized protein LOC119674579 n=1 Tax=Teleopsis dalmanni TaxID=139649 RepID=UPI0018CD8245|nr:uncharacterized protein LOC119674579 [Teleopsis dalmanni]XP_037952785.1 uncharacterized protein LOC119683224 [Teleopsis dalmanni]
MFQIAKLFAQRQVISTLGNKNLLNLGENLVKSVLRKFGHCDTCGPVKIDCVPVIKKKPVCELFTAIKQRKQYEKELKKRRIRSVWGEIPDCCVDSCPIPPRYDELYYRPSNPHNRLYEQTWIDCLERTPKLMCYYPEEQYLPPKRRPRKPRKKSCLNMVKPNNLGLMQCIKPFKGCNPKMHVCGCKPVAANVSCTVVRNKTICRKVNSPWPSFSECNVATNKKPIKECDCLSPVPLCTFIRYLKEKKRFY